MTTDKKDRIPNAPDKGLVPKLRFPEFVDEWKVKRLGDDCEIQMCKRIFANQTSEIGDVPFYKIGTIGGSADAFISKELFSEYKAKYNFPQKGEVLITCAGTVGKTVIYDGEDAYYQDSNIVWISNPRQYYTNAFLQRVLSRIDWSKLNTTTIVRIYNDNLRDLKIAYPSIVEQGKISSLLGLIDERITTQSRAIEKLQSLMVEIAKSLTDHSPNTKISDCLDCHNSVLQESQVAELGTYPVYGANGVCGHTDTPLINGDSILIVKDGSGVGKVSFATGKFSVVGTSNYLTAKEGYSLRYLYYCLMCFNFTSYKTGMAIPHIYFKDYGKARIYCPSFEEQERIAKALFKIETKIGIEQSLFEQFSLQKQFLLQEMFI